jgi:DNA modification methylase
MAEAHRLLWCCCFPQPFPQAPCYDAAALPLAASHQDPEVMQALSSVDWNFASVRPRQHIHSVHPYPAKFIPEIPRQLIELFHPQDGSGIFDPFCGSGTALVEAIEQGLDACGVDLNPLACLIARVKTSPLSCDLSDAIRRAVATSKNVYSVGTAQVPEIPRLGHWFKPEIQSALAALTSSVERVQDRSIREALQVAISSIIVQVSNQESDTRYAAIEKNVSGDDVFDKFERAAFNLNQALMGFRGGLFGHVGRATVINADTLDLRSIEIPFKVGLVITSPPYPNAYEYWLYHKYRMYWLKMDPIGVRQHEIGARPHYFKTNHQDETDFERQMSTCFKLLAEIMKPRAKACFLVGRSIIHGRVIDNVALLRRAAEPHGFAFDGSIERQILRTRKAFNPSNSKINEEHVAIFSLLSQ